LIPRSPSTRAHRLLMMATDLEKDLFQLSNFHGSALRPIMAENELRKRSEGLPVSFNLRIGEIFYVSSSCGTHAKFKNGRNISKYVIRRKQYEASAICNIQYEHN